MSSNQESWLAPERWREWKLETPHLRGDQRRRQHRGLERAIWHQVSERQTFSYRLIIICLTTGSLETSPLMRYRSAENCRRPFYAVFRVVCSTETGTTLPKWFGSPGSRSYPRHVVLYIYRACRSERAVAKNNSHFTTILLRVDNSTKVLTTTIRTHREKKWARTPSWR